MGTRETIHLTVRRFPLDNAICDRQHSGNKIDWEDSFVRWFFVSNSLRTADVFYVKQELKNASAPRRLCEQGHRGNKTTE